ncbi:MAG: DUF6443 domain-containing protein, partial [Bacteroidales bacterium]|nr:DUF6443 domain-containing protein [Bacteroidales bacterium]
MKPIINIIALLLPILVISQIGDDGWNNRTINTYQNDIEVARQSMTFVPGFDTQGHSDFEAYIDPYLPLNGGIPVNDGEFNMNYIRQYTPIHDNATSAIPDHNGLNYDLWVENITYYDGLGRPIQKIAVKGTVAGTDLIQPIVYDDYGRIKEEYLPYAIAQLSGGSGGPGGGDGTPGGYRPNFLPEQQNFYGFYNPGEEQNTFAEKEFDNSPLNRVMKRAAPGQPWQLNGGHEVEFQYLTNSANEVVLYEVDQNSNLVRSGFYQQNTLFDNLTIDENQNQVKEFIDKQNRVVLQSSYDNSQWLSTYYVYDDFGLLRYVIPPIASSILYNSGGQIGNIYSNQTIQDYCYYYEYDARKRMKMKKLPGAEPVYMVYNKRDQLVLTQDGNLRVDTNWLFTKYDVFNRPVMTGKYHHFEEISQVEMQSDVVDINI